MRDGLYLRPRSLDELWSLWAAHPGARLIAGGTDVMVRIADRVERPAALLSLRGIEELSRIEAGETGARIGAGATIAEVIEHPDLGASYPVLVEAARLLGSPQIRSVATVGGNLCNASPCADTAPPLLVLDAAVRLRGPSGTRDLPLAGFFEGPGATRLGEREILESVLLPPPLPGARGAFLKKRRVHVDLALASVAVLLVVEGRTCRAARVAAGSVAPTPVRLASVENLIEGRELTEAVAAASAGEAARCVAPITDLRATEAYRRHIVGVYLRRAVARIAGSLA